ncbi:MAG: hypothetical protein KBE65_19000 [Phycisphaerae bacterium]|nr:hypothetical protein [Phycisphaerae bacterium]
MNHGFIKLHRSPETLELLNDPNAFILLTVIALRARRTDEFNLHNLQSGEALLGDHAKCGLTRGQYRTAMKRLRQWGFATFKPTTHGTVATLCSTRVYDINEATNDQQPTTRRPTDDQRATTNKKEKKQKNEKKYSPHSDEWKLSELLLSLIVEGKGDFRKPDLARWAGDIGRMTRVDGRTRERIEAVIRWCVKDPFWSKNILSAASLRKHFDRLELQMGGQVPKESLRDRMTRLERQEMP